MKSSTDAKDSPILKAKKQRSPKKQKPLERWDVSLWLRFPSRMKLPPLSHGPVVPHTQTEGKKCQTDPRMIQTPDYMETRFYTSGKS